MGNRQEKLRVEKKHKKETDTLGIIESQQSRTNPQAKNLPKGRDIHSETISVNPYKTRS